MRALFITMIRIYKDYSCNNCDSKLWLGIAGAGFHKNYINLEVEIYLN